MIADLDDTIRQLLVDEMPIRNGEIDVKFDQPKREWSSRLTKPTINFYLYDIRENVNLRHHQWEQISNGGGGRGGVGLNIAQMKRTPYRVDCFYMLTTWANEPEDEHRLLSEVLTALFRFPLIPRERLKGDLPDQPYDLQGALARHDRLTNPAEVWGALDNEMRPSVSYVVTLAVDPWKISEVPMTRTSSIQTGQAAPRSRAFTPGAANDPTYRIRGSVHPEGDLETPLVGYQVAMRGTGYVDTTDEKGEFNLGRLGAGEYTLVIWPPEGRPIEKAIAVPASSGNYDLEI